MGKWENDISYPDICYYQILRDLLGVSVDELCGAASAQETEATQAALLLGNALLRSFPLHEPAQIVEEPVEQDKSRVLLLGVSGFSFGKLFGKSMVKVEKNDEAVDCRQEEVAATLVTVL